MWLAASLHFALYKQNKGSMTRLLKKTSFVSPHGAEERNWEKFVLPLMKKDYVSYILICGTCVFDNREVSYKNM